MSETYLHRLREWLKVRRVKRRVRNSPHGWYREGGRVYFRRPKPAGSPDQETTP